MKKLLLLVLAASLIFSAGAYGFTTFPSPTINGATGLVRVPSADILPYKNFAIGVDYGSNSMAQRESLYYKVNIGAFNNIEMGVVGGYDQTNNTSTLREGVFVNLKLSLSTDDSSYPLLLALGAENLASFTQAGVYMVATKYMKQGFKLTFGFLADFPANKFRPMGVAGLEFPMMDDHLVLLCDGMAGETIAQVDAGIRIYFVPWFAITGSALNIFQDQNNPQGKDPKSYLVGFSWVNPF
ncbi:MAG: hypothetical protein KKB81_04290 [Candidatus Margulisbacteria bacterium]|nr:hypothetical protein [Candidatus Margulisiibacteriota bacterium]MBU1021965.1 hypothetical protein [Candidatus Margulisiibacteriota bacterium]MBU1728944.1 hypothetical protein [Candidatus Margulisiibacteriota bacterium]MBU1954750.1 hypothetical protein [Candidatus Margulisiibacteriota bacterium]